jgi:hypothetical protein
MVSVLPLANALAANINGFNWDFYFPHVSTALLGLDLPTVEVSRLEDYTQSHHGR